MRHNQPQVIQGNFLGSGPRIAVQARPHTPTAAQRPMAPHVQAALQKNAPSFQAVQQKPASLFPNTAQPPVVQRIGAGKATQIPTSHLNLRPAHTGQRLPEAVQRKMETVFGASFADVRIHVGYEAASMGARAFTHGSHIYFAPGHYQPMTPNGQRLLGHELAHVVQQKAGRVKSPFRDGVAVVQDPGLEAEAERMGLRAAQMKSGSRSVQIIQPSSSIEERDPRFLVAAAAPPASASTSASASASTSEKDDEWITVERRKKNKPRGPRLSLLDRDINRVWRKLGDQKTWITGKGYGGIVTVKKENLGKVRQFFFEQLDDKPIPHIRGYYYVTRPTWGKPGFRITAHTRTRARGRGKTFGVLHVEPG